MGVADKFDLVIKGGDMLDPSQSLRGKRETEVAPIKNSRRDASNIGSWGSAFTLEQVVTMATATPAGVIKRAPKLGTLQIGAPADVSIMELVEGPVSFVARATTPAPARRISSPCRRSPQASRSGGRTMPRLQ